MERLIGKFLDQKRVGWVAMCFKNLVGIVFNRIFISINLYVPRTQMGPLVLLEKGPCFGGLTFKNRGHLGSRYIYI